MRTGNQLAAHANFYSNYSFNFTTFSFGNLSHSLSASELALLLALALGPLGTGNTYGIGI